MHVQLDKWRLETTQVIQPKLLNRSNFERFIGNGATPVVIHNFELSGSTESTLQALLYIVLHTTKFVL